MRYRAILQLTSGDEDVFKSASSQINNLLRALSNNVEIEMVCHGRSLPFILKENNKWAPILQQLLCNNIKILACENMLQSNGKKATDLFPGIGTVPAAVAELVIKQNEGWSYLKAGF